MTNDTFSAWLESELTAALADMDRQVDGVSACQLEKNSRVTSGIKVTEGRVAALSELRRNFRRDPDGNFVSHLDSRLQTWRADLQQKQGQAAVGVWTAYLQGGVDALEAAVRFMTPACSTEPQQD